MKWLLFVMGCVFSLECRPQKPQKQELLFRNPPFLQCHASTIVELQSGKLLAACFGGTEEGNKDVAIWLTEHQKGRWRAPRVLAADKTFPCWNPVLFQSQSGKLFLFYKVGPNPREWWGMMIFSTDQGKTWSTPARLPEGIIGPVKNKPLQLNEGKILSPSSAETHDRWSAHVEVSTDDGMSWQKIAVDSTGSFNAIQPSIIQYPDGRLQLLCRSKEGNVLQSWSDNDGESWTALTATGLPNPNSGTDAITVQPGLQLIVYNPLVPGKEWWEGRSVLSVALSEDGRSWQKLLDLEQHEKGEYSYPAVIRTRNGDIHITYTYNRRNIRHVVLTPDLWRDKFINNGRNDP